MSAKDFSDRENEAIDSIARLLGVPLDPLRRRLVVEMAWLGGRASGREITADALPNGPKEGGVDG